LIDSLSPCLIMLTFSLNSSIIPFIRHSSNPNPHFSFTYPIPRYGLQKTMYTNYYLWIPLNPMQK
jgi:hypothetical protein